MRIEKISIELVKIFISHGMGGLLIYHKGNYAVRTINAKDGGSHVFAITKNTIDVVYFNQLKKSITPIALINTHDPHVPDQLEDVVSQICEDYSDAEEVRWGKLPNGFQSFEPSDWWKYGAPPVSE